MGIVAEVAGQGGVETPNLEALRAQSPRRKMTLIRLLWPTIRECLDGGHTVREVRESLRKDGIEVNYKNLCACIAELREVDKGGSRSAPTAAPAVREKTPVPVPLRKPASVGGDQRASDPLENVRRLSGNGRPGFQYPGTLSDEELFGR